MARDGLLDSIQGLAEAAKRVRLPPGVIGKSSFITYGVAGAWVVVLFRLSNNWWLDGILIASAVLFTLYAMRETGKMRKYAEDNPELALMEGADITEYKRFEAQSKFGITGTGLLSADPMQPPPVVGGPDRAE